MFGQPSPGALVPSITLIMSYHRSTPRRSLRAALGATSVSNQQAQQYADLAKKAKSVTQSLQSGIVSAVDVASMIAADPALPDVGCRVAQLYALENKQPVRTCPPTRGASGPGGIGLSAAVPALKAWVYAKRHPWAVPVGAAAVLGIPFLLGYLAGRH